MIGEEEASQMVEEHDTGWHHWLDHFMVPGGIGCMVVMAIVGAWATSKFRSKRKQSET